MKILIKAFDVFLFSAAALVVWGWLTEADYLLREVLLFGLVAVGALAVAYAIGALLLALIALVIVLSSKSAKERFWKAFNAERARR